MRGCSEGRYNNDPFIYSLWDRTPLSVASSINGLYRSLLIVIDSRYTPVADLYRNSFFADNSLIVSGIAASNGKRDDTSEFRSPAPTCVEKSHPEISGSIVAPAPAPVPQCGGWVGGRARANFLDDVLVVY